MNKAIFILLLIIFFTHDLSAQIPDFYREDLTFILDDSSLIIIFIMPGKRIKSWICFTLFRKTAPTAV